MNPILQQSNFAFYQNLISQTVQILWLFFHKKLLKLENTRKKWKIAIKFERFEISSSGKKQNYSAVKSGSIMFSSFDHQRALGEICIFCQIFFKFSNFYLYESNFASVLKDLGESPGQGGSKGTFSFWLWELVHGYNIKSMKIFKKFSY